MRPVNAVRPRIHVKMLKSRVHAELETWPNCGASEDFPGGSG
jgi:hypothetical protein